MDLSFQNSIIMAPQCRLCLKGNLFDPVDSHECTLGTYSSNTNNIRRLGLFSVSEWRLSFCLCPFSLLCQINLQSSSYWDAMKYIALFLISLLTKTPPPRCCLSTSSWENDHCYRTPETLDLLRRRSQLESLLHGHQNFHHSERCLASDDSCNLLS